MQVSVVPGQLYLNVFRPVEGQSLNVMIQLDSWRAGKSLERVIVGADDMLLRRQLMLDCQVPTARLPELLMRLVQHGDKMPWVLLNDPGDYRVQCWPSERAALKGKAHILQ